MKVGDFVLAKVNLNIIEPGQIIKKFSNQNGQCTHYTIRLMKVANRDYVMSENELTFITHDQAMLFKLENN